MNIRQCTENDAKVISDIYNYYIEHTVITFEETLVNEAIMANRIKSVMQHYPWLVIENIDGELCGYAYATKWSERSAYNHTVEITVYLHHKAQGNGYGSSIYKALLDELRNRGFHCVIAVIALPNEASIKLQESLGFTKVAHFKEVGRKFDRWIDVGSWHKVFH